MPSEGEVPHLRLPSACALFVPYSGIAPSLQGLFPGLPRIGVRVVGVRGDGAEISGAQVIDAPDQLELIRVRLIWTHVAIAWSSHGPRSRTTCLCSAWRVRGSVTSASSGFACGSRLAVFWLIISSAAGYLRADVDYLPGPTAP